MTAATASRPLPKSYLSAEEREILLREGSQNLVYIAEAQEADNNKDGDTAWAWLALTDVPAHTLMSLKNRRGAAFIRELGFNTRKADEKYGPGWLDRD